MSAFTGNRPQLAIAQPQLSGGLENILSVARTLEQALGQERTRSEQMFRELEACRGQARLQVGELTHKNNESQILLDQLRQELLTENTRRKSADQNAVAYRDELIKHKQELSRYRNAWNAVMQRDQEARKILTHGAQVMKELASAQTAAREFGEKIQLEKMRADQLDRHLANYQSELRNSLIRLHRAEARCTEITENLHQAEFKRRESEERALKVEEELKIRFHRLLNEEKALLQSTLQKAVEDETYCIHQESTAHVENVMKDLERERSKSETVQKVYHSRLEQAVQENRALKDEIRANLDTLEGLRAANELAASAAAESQQALQTLRQNSYETQCLLEKEKADSRLKSQESRKYETVLKKVQTEAMQEKLKREALVRVLKSEFKTAGPSQELSKMLIRRMELIKKIRVEIHVSHKFDTIRNGLKAEIRRLIYDCRVMQADLKKQKQETAKIWQRLDTALGRDVVFADARVPGKTRDH